jgi:hypothetical protein
MSCKCEEEFNPWPSFVDIFSSVILVLLLFLLVVLANLGYYAQFKYKVSFNGSISTDELITTTSSSANTTETTTSSGSPTSNPNSDINVQIIKEQKQMILALQNQLNADPTNIKSAKGSDEIESAGINVADKKEDSTEVQKMVTADEYLIITYKADELFVDDVISKQLKQFLENAKSKYKNHQINIYSSDIKDQLSSTISKQISLARTMSVRNLIKKFGYEKKDIKIDLASKAEVKEAVDAKNGYLVIKIIK